MKKSESLSLEDIKDRSELGGEIEKTLSRMSVFQTNNILLALLLKDDLISDSNIKKVVSCVIKSDSPKALHLDGILLNQIVANYIQNIIESKPMFSTKSLTIENSQIETQGIKLLTEALNENSEVNDLCFRNVTFNQETLTTLTKGLKANNIIQRLVLGNVSLGKDGIKTISDFLKINSTIIELNLKGLDFTLSACKALGEALALNETVEVLIFQENKVEISGTKFILSAINKRATVLEELEIDNITSTDYGALYSIICENKVKGLSLDVLKMTEKEIISILKVVSNSQHLVILNISFNSVPKEFYKFSTELVSDIQHNFVMTYYELFITNKDNESQKYQNQIGKLIDRNQKLLGAFSKNLLDGKIISRFKVNCQLEEPELHKIKNDFERISLKSLAYLKHCDKYQLLHDIEIIEKYREYKDLELFHLPEITDKLFGKYLSSEYYVNNFFILAGICKKTLQNVFRAEEDSSEFSIIIELSKQNIELLEHIISFIPLEDYKLELSGSDSSGATSDGSIEHIG